MGLRGTCNEHDVTAAHSEINEKINDVINTPDTDCEYPAQNGETRPRVKVNDGRKCSNLLDVNQNALVVTHIPPARARPAMEATAIFRP